MSISIKHKAYINLTDLEHLKNAQGRQVSLGVQVHDFYIKIIIEPEVVEKTYKDSSIEQWRIGPLKYEVIRRYVPACFWVLDSTLDSEAHAQLTLAGARPPKHIVDVACPELTN